MLTLKNIFFSVSGKTLVDNVSASFKEGKLNLIVGPNGAGKSTIIRMISGQIAPTSGTICFGEESTTVMPIHQMAKVRAVLSQQIELAFPLKVWEVVMMGRYPHFVSQPSIIDERVCQEAMRFFDIWDLAERNYMTLSGGEKQRVQFARVLTQIWVPINEHPRYLLLDEPLTFLDIHYQFQFMKQLQTLLREQNLVVIGVVHDLNLAARFADTIMLLYQGRVLAQGTATEVFTQENIMTAFQLKSEMMKKAESIHLYFE